MYSQSQRLAPIFVLALVFAGLGAVNATPAQSATYGKATKISAGGYSACAITPAERLKCWGYNYYGQLGLGADLGDQLEPVLVPDLENVRQVSVGDYHTCAVLQGGKLKCWGYNYYGEVGDGTTKDRHKPRLVTGLDSGVESVSAGSYHTCALLKNGKVKCWGDNYYGQVGNDTSENRYKTPKFVSNIDAATQVSAGYSYTCATVNERAKCWGYNAHGELGDNTKTSRDKPTQVYNLDKNVKRVIAGNNTTCALIKNGKLKCWGSNAFGEVGTGATGGEYKKPVQVLGMTDGVTSADTDDHFTCAVRNGHAKCWGDNEYNQLGDGTTDDRDTPHQVSGLTSRVTHIDISFYSGCALLESGTEKCWGYNTDGQVGIGSIDDQIPMPKTVHL